MGKDSVWKIIYKGFNPSEESLREAICTLGNGYLGTRGAACEAVASNIHYPGTYIAGIYNRLTTNIAGKRVINEDMVNCPNWLFLTFRIKKGEWFSPSKGHLLYYSQQLDMRRGILIRELKVKDHQGRITHIRTQRLVHMGNPHYMAIQYIITPQNYSDWVTVRSLLDGGVLNSGVERYRQLNSKHLDLSALGSFSRNGVYLSVVTNQSKIEIATAAKLRLFVDGKERNPLFKLVTKNKLAIGEEFRINVRRGSFYIIEKIVSIYTSKDKGVRDPIMEAITALKKSPRFNALLYTHQKQWQKLWNIFDVFIDGDDFSQKVIRLHIFHLLQTVSPHNINIDGGFPARGLHGESYRGHIFWDEIFAMPFYNFHIPDISRALLLYRYRRLNKAKEYAKKCGYKGAMFPWQSGSTGEEETQVIHLNPLSGKWNPDYSRYQRHVSFAIAYNIWYYFKNTDDYDFMLRYGAEMFLSIAQFAESLAYYNKKDKRYHTKGIMGPDEFHEKYPNSSKPGLKDNAYSNFMISWILAKAIELIKLLPSKKRKDLMKRIGIKKENILVWDKISRNMNIIMDKNRVISQFDGYFNLKELNWANYKAIYGNIQRMDRILKAEGLSSDDYKVTKQADVLMIFYLFSLEEIKKIFEHLGYPFDKNIIKNNYLYYLKRTSHGSTLSKVVHCLIALYLRRNKEAQSFFKEVLESDIYDLQGGTTPEGIHTGVMAGSFDIIIRGFAGINIVGNLIMIKPRLLPVWRRLKFKLLIKKQWVYFDLTKKEISITVKDSFSKIPLYILVANKKAKLKKGKKTIVRYSLIR
mgnify:CR=1 FL=1